MTAHDDNPARRIQQALPAALPAYLKSRRWFAGKSETLTAIEVEDSIPMRGAFLFWVRVRYASGSAQRYAIPLAATPLSNSPSAAGSGAAQIVVPPAAGFAGCILSDALEDPRFASLLLDCIRNQASIEGAAGALTGERAQVFPKLAGATPSAELEPSVMRVEQSNTSIRYGRKLMLKFYRRPEEGVNLDYETGRFLTDKAGFEHTPPVAGAVEYRCAGRPAATLAVLQGFIENLGDAWSYTLQQLDRYFERNASLSGRTASDWAASGAPLDLAASGPPDFASEAIGGYLDSAALLGRRTAELHLALSHDRSDADFAPEPFTRRDAAALSQAALELAAQSLSLLEARLAFLPLPVREKALRLIEHKESLFGRCRAILSRPIEAERARVHGDYHLGQALYTGTDFVIIDFEGEPERPLSERRHKQSPLRDVAGMLRSFHYAVSTALLRRASAATPGRPAWLDASARFWRIWVSAQFLRTYLHTAGDAPFVPASRDQLQLLLDLFLIDKAVYEIIYELRNRPDWVAIPLDGILDALLPPA